MISNQKMPLNTVFSKKMSFSLTVILASLFGSMLLFQSCAEEPINPPSILWIVSEDNGIFLGCYGDRIARTPNLDNLAANGIRFTNAFATAPVCAPARSALITGMYPIALGTENMRSAYSVPDYIKFYPYYLKQAGYWTSNNYKKDYNTLDQEGVWDESGREASYIHRKQGQPFFHIYNLTTTHESSLHKGLSPVQTDPAEFKLPPYQPDIKEVRSDWAIYYDQMGLLDDQVGEILKELKEQGLSDSTIVFYYSDHGGVLARSKRFLFDNGLHVPMIVHIPKAYKHLMPTGRGNTVENPVSFIDMAPTLLNLAGVDVPAFMQGKAFLGNNVKSDNEFVFACRGRMDERIDLSRSVTDCSYRYTRNFMPFRPYGQHLSTLWKAPSMKAIEEAYLMGELNEVQERFFKPKPYEELYDIKEDPHNIHNLADKDEYSDVLSRFRAAMDEWQIENRDAGLIPEAILFEINQEMAIFHYTHSEKYPIVDILNIAKMAAEGDPENIKVFARELSNSQPVIRYWAALGLLNLGEQAESAAGKLAETLQDSSFPVRIFAAEALYKLGERESLVDPLIPAISHENIMIKVMALNTLEQMDAVIPSFVPEIQKLIRDPGDRNYDNRLMWRILYRKDI